MEDLARRFADRAHFLLIYVREAHPGEFYPPHQYSEQKLLHARAIRVRGVARTIWWIRCMARCTGVTAASPKCRGSSTTPGMWVSGLPGRSRATSKPR